MFLDLPVINSLLFDIIKACRAVLSPSDMTVCLPVINSFLFDIIKDMQSGS